MVDLAYRASMADGFTAPAKAVRDSANAMGQAVENAGRVAEESSERVRRSARSFAQLVTANDDAARAAAANSKIQAKLARDVQTVNAEVAAGLATQQQANALIKDMTEKAALASAQVDRRIAREKLQRAAITETTAATTEQARALQGLRGQYDPLYAAQQRLGTSMRDIEKLERAGFVSAQQALALRERETRGYGERSRELTGVAAAERAAAAAAEQHGAELTRLQGRLSGYVRAVDPLAASLDAVTRAERDLLAARRMGATVTSDQVAAVVRMRERHEEMAAASRQSGGAIRLQAHEVTNLTYQLQDAAVQLAGGQNPFLILMQQGPQATGALGGTSRALALLRQELTPTRLAMVAITAAVVAMAVAVHTQESALSNMRNGLRGVTSDYAAAAVEMEASAKRIAAAGLGIGRQEARDGLLTLRQVAPRGASIDYDAAGRDAANLAAILRTEVSGAFELMARLGKDAGAVVEELREKGIRGMTRELQGQAEALQANGQRWEAQTLVMGRLRPVMQGAAQDVPPLTTALRELRSAWDGFIDKASTGLGGAAVAMLRDLSQLLSLVEKAVNLARSIPGMKQFMEIADAGPVEAGLAARRSLGLGDGGTTTAPSTASVPWSVPADLRPAFANAAATTGVDVELLARVFAREGVRNRDGSWRDSSVGAIGPMQVMPGTFADMAKKYGIEGTARDDGANVMASARYLTELIKRSPDDLPRALAGYNAGPDREGLGAPALGGTYARRVLDGYTGSGLVIRAQQAEISSTSTTPLVLPEVRVEASADVRLDRALAISRGELKPEPYSSREAQSTWYRQAMGEIETARGLTEDPRSLDILKNGYREVAKALEAARSPQEQMREEMDRAYASARILDPAQRALTEAVQAYEERVKAVGDIPTDAGRNEARAAKLRELGLAYAAASFEVGKSLQGQDRLAAAWGQGREAVERLTAEEKAREVVRAAGIQGEAAQEAAVQSLADAYQRLTAGQADNAQRAANDNARGNLEVLEEERRLIGASADERERELAGYRAVQQARRGGVRDEGVLAETRQLARSTVDVTRANTQLRNSWDELSRVGEQAFDRIGSSITEAFANGSLKAVDFKNIAKAALSEVAQEAGRMALVNPVLNYFDGGTRGTLGGVLTVAGAAGGSAAAANDNGNSGMVGYAQQGVQAYSAYSKLSGINPTSSINGSSAFNTGWGGLDGALNTPIWGANSGINAGGAVTNSAGYGSMAQNAIDAGGSASSAGVGGLTYGGAAAGALGIAGGAYTAYQGVQRGGVGGYTQAAGGAATAGLSAAAMAGMAVPVYGWIAAIALTVLGSMLPGQKPSDKTGTALFDTLDPSNPTIGGLNGDRYSSENREQARAVGQQLSSIAQTVGDAAGLSQAVVARYEVAFGSRDGITVGINGQKLQGAADEAGITAITKAFASQMISLARDQATDANVRNVIDRSGNADPEATLGNLEWYRTTYKALSETVDPSKTGSFAQAMDQVQTKFDAIREKATALGLSLDPVTKAFEQERDALNKARVTAFDSSINDMMDQASLLRGGNVLPMQLEAFDRQRTAEWEAKQASIWDAGFDQRQVDDAWKAFIPLKELQRQALIDQNDAARTSNANALADRIATADSSAETLAGQLASYDRQALLTFQTAQRDGITDLTQLARAQAAERLTIEKRFAEQAEALRQSYEDRIWAATVDTSTVAGALADFDRSAARQRVEEAKKVGADLVLLEQAQGTERVKLLRQFAEQEREALRGLGGSIRAYVDGLRSTPNGGRSPADQLSAAQDVFGRDLALARGGDQDALGRITSSADTLLSAGRQMYASGTEFQQLHDWIAATLEALPATRSYDAMILEELRKLGGAIDVSVELTTIRIITEQLNALPASERDRLIQAEVVLRSVEDRLGRALTMAERGLLIDSAVVLRDIEQGLGRDLTAAERALLLDSAQIQRTVQQALGRDLTAAERAGLVQAATVQRLIEQQLGRQLTEAERATLLSTLTATRTVEQILGRDLTAAERATLLASATVLRTVEQGLGRVLTAAEVAQLLASGTVTRDVQELLGRVLTPAEQAALIAGGGVIRSIQDVLGRQLTAAEQAALIQSANVVRTVSQAVETTETVQISRSIDDKLGGLLAVTNDLLWQQLGIASDMRGLLARVAGVDDGVTIRYGRDANQLMQDIRGYMGTFNTIFSAHGVKVKGMESDGLVRVGSSAWSHSIGDAASIIRFAKGGIIGGGEILMGPTDYTLPDGSRVQAGEAGPEAFLPLDRGPDGRLGLTAPMPLTPMPLPPMPMAGGGDLVALQTEVVRLAALLAQLLAQQQAEAARQALADAKAQQAREQQVEGIEDMTESNRRLAVNGRGVMAQRAGVR